VFVWDRGAASSVGAIRLVSGTTENTPAGTDASRPVIAADGSAVIFESADPAVIPGQVCSDRCPMQVLWVDLDTEPMVRQVISAAPGPDGTPQPGRRSSFVGDLDANGAQIVFVTSSAELSSVAVPMSRRADRSDDRSDPAGPVGDVLVADVALGGLRRLSDPIAAGIPAVHAAPTMSATGREVLFETLVPERFDDRHLTVAPSDVAQADVAQSDVAERHLVAVSFPARVSMPPLDFGTVLVDWPSDELYVSLFNAGPGAFAPGAVISSVPEVEITPTGTCTPGRLVAAGESCTVTAIFTPTAEGPISGTITVAERGPRAQSVTVAVSGSGGEPALQATPAGLDVDPVVVGARGAPVAVSVANVGWVNAIIASVVISGDHAEDFSIATDRCRGRELRPRAECSIEVSFAPGGAHRRLAVITITTTTGEYTAVIIGGTGRYEPALFVPDTMVPAGGTIALVLDGFPPNAEVIMSLSELGRPLAVVRTGADGSALARIDIDRRARAGIRRLVATGPDGTQAQVEVEILRRRGAVIGLPGSGSG